LSEGGGTSCGLLVRGNGGRICLRIRESNGVVEVEVIEGLDGKEE